ncbi:MAG: hypothetical protein II085_04795 [Alphaproteobacteria bacterium]|nr:hypothetical protein [Alphaproteobacteria bacterium]
MEYIKQNAHIWDKLIITVAIAMVIPNFAATKGIMGFNIPVYTSFVKCAIFNQN